MKTILRLAAVPAVLMLVVLTSVAEAQTTTSSHLAKPTSAMAPADQRSEKREDLVEKRIDALHSQLKITPQQAPQWNAFAHTMRQNAQMMEQAFHERILKLPSMTAVEAMKSYAAIAQMNADNMQRLSATFDELYGVLSPGQQVIADRLFKNEHPPQRKTPQSMK